MDLRKANQGAAVRLPKHDFAVSTAKCVKPKHGHTVHLHEQRHERACELGAAMTSLVLLSSSLVAPGLASSATLSITQRQQLEANDLSDIVRLRSGSFSADSQGSSDELSKLSGIEVRQSPLVRVSVEEERIQPTVAELDEGQQEPFERGQSRAETSVTQGKAASNGVSTEEIPSLGAKTMQDSLEPSPLSRAPPGEKMANTVEDLTGAAARSKVLTSKPSKVAMGTRNSDFWTTVDRMGLLLGVSLSAAAGYAIHTQQGTTEALRDELAAERAARESSDAKSSQLQTQVAALQQQVAQVRRELQQERLRILTQPHGNATTGSRLQDMLARQLQEQQELVRALSGALEQERQVTTSINLRTSHAPEDMIMPGADGTVVITKAHRAAEALLQAAAGGATDHGGADNHGSDNGVGGGDSNGRLPNSHEGSNSSRNGMDVDGAVTI